MNLTTTKFTDNLKIEKNNYTFVSLKKAESKFNFIIEKLPFSYRILLENLIRKIDSTNTNKKDLENLINQRTGEEILFSPSRVLMQDYTGVPAIADLAAMREAVKESGGKAENINPLSPVDLVIDHSVMVDKCFICTMYI